VFFLGWVKHSSMLIRYAERINIFLRFFLKKNRKKNLFAISLRFFLFTLTLVNAQTLRRTYKYLFAFFFKKKTEERISLRSLCVFFSLR
jgi:hypothetical protein